MKCAGEDEVVVCVDILQTRVEVSLVHQTPGLVNDYQGEDDPVKPCCQYLEALFDCLKAGPYIVIIIAGSTPSAMFKAFALCRKLFQDSRNLCCSLGKATQDSQVDSNV